MDTRWLIGLALGLAGCAIEGAGPDDVDVRVGDVHRLPVRTPAEAVRRDDVGHRLADAAVEIDAIEAAGLLAAVGEPADEEAPESAGALSAARQQRSAYNIWVAAGAVQDPSTARNVGGPVHCAARSLGST